MRMRDIMKLYESRAPANRMLLSDIDREAIIKKMTDSYVAGEYWDDAALARYPGRSFDSDDVHDMHNTWADEDGYPLGDLDSNDAIAQPEFHARLEDWSRARLAEVEAKLAAIPKTGNAYVLHRIMKVPSKWWSKVQKQGHTNLGVHWTYDFDEWNNEVGGAYPVWAKNGMKGIDITIKATVEATDIDWPYSIMANMDWYSGDREYELRVLPGHPVNVTEITAQDQPLDTAGISFTAYK